MGARWVPSILNARNTREADGSTRLTIWNSDDDASSGSDSAARASRCTTAILLTEMRLSTAVALRVPEFPQRFDGVRRFRTSRSFTYTYKSYLATSRGLVVKIATPSAA